VKIYKERGGEYIGKKNPNNSLTKWSKENWQYAGSEGKSRYLPKKIIDALPKKIIETENKLKGNKLGQKIPYTNELKKIMKSKNIF
jgi:hypothetical protein